MVLRRRPTLPHPGGCSTIGAEGLSFRVRDGTGRFPFAVTAANSVELSIPGASTWCGGGGGSSGTAQWTRSNVCCGEAVG